ncbi:MAG: sigma-70 family RNA polymerase sigma factor [Planctomycetota bacterium]
MSGIPFPDPAIRRLVISIDTEKLLLHRDWLRELAGRLILDDQRADDAVQQACLLALEHPPARFDHPRGWLATVLRNVIRQEARSEKRRARREQAAAREEALPASDELVARADTQRRLVAAVLELEEPQRTAILLRYFEGLSSAEIGRRSGEPAATVRSRVHRGLQELRRRLDEEHEGDSGQWHRALLPLLLPPSAGSIVPRPEAAKETEVSVLRGERDMIPIPKAVTWLSAAAVFGLLTYFAGSRLDLGSDGETTAGGSARARSAAEPESPSSGALASGPAASVSQETESQSDQEKRRLSSPVATARVLTGEAFTRDGKPAAGAAVMVLVETGALQLGGETIGESQVGPEGRFEVRLHSAPERVAVRVDGGVNGIAWRRDLERGAQGDFDAGRLTLTPVFHLTGIVVDPFDRPVPGATVAASISMGADLVDWSTRADGAGRFSLPCTGVGGEADLFAVHDDWGLGFVGRAVCGKDPVTIRLTEPQTVRGTVLDSAGAPIQGAEVALDVALWRITHTWGRFPEDPPRLVTTGPDGRFVMHSVQPGDVYLRIRAEDHYIEEHHSKITAGVPPEEIIVQLQAQPEGQLFAGVVVDARTGDPIAGARVGEVMSDDEGRFECRKRPTSILDRPFQPSLTARAHGYSDCTLDVPHEGDATGLRFELRRAVRIEALIVFADGTPAQDAYLSFDGDAEKAKALGVPKPDSYMLQTSVDGTVRGEVDPGPYSLIRAYHPSAAHHVDLKGIEVTSEQAIEWRFVIGEGPDIRGRVLDDATGAPIADAEVHAYLGEGERRWPRLCQTVSGSEGSFLLRGFEQETVWLLVKSAQHAPRVLEVHPRREESLEIRLGKGLTFQGRLELKSGEPVQDASVRLEARGNEAETKLLPAPWTYDIEEDGTFGFEHLPEVPFEVIIYVSRERRDELKAPQGLMLRPPFPAQTFFLEKR